MNSAGKVGYPQIKKIKLDLYIPTCETNLKKNQRF